MQNLKKYSTTSSKPIYWKQVLITTLSVYPLLLGTGWLLNFLFPMQQLIPEVAVFFTVVVVASLMFFPVMPNIMKYSAPWLHRRTTIPNLLSFQKMSKEAKTKLSVLLTTKTRRLESSGLTIRYAELGDSTKPPIILLHGVPENLQAWYALAPRLAENYHVFAIDWPGFGGSESFDSKRDYTSSNFAKVIVAFMDSLVINKASLLATDIGLLPALLAGINKPDRFSKLIVSDGIPFPRPQYASWELRSFARKGSIIGKALVEWFPYVSSQIAYFKGFYRGHSIPKEVRNSFLVDGRSKKTQEAFLSYFQNFHIDQKYFETRASDLKIPVLVVWGKYDRFINVKLAYEIVDSLPNAELRVIDKSGHYVHMDTPEKLFQVVHGFLNENNPRIMN